MSQETSQGCEDFRTRFQGAELENCCGVQGGEMAEFMKACPCASLIRHPRRAFFGMLAGAALLFSITAVGWVLGILAFFRTV